MTVFRVFRGEDEIRFGERCGPAIGFHEKVGQRLGPQLALVAQTNRHCFIRRFLRVTEEQDLARKHLILRLLSTGRPYRLEEQENNENRHGPA